MSLSHFSNIQLGKVIKKTVALTLKMCISYFFSLFGDDFISFDFFGTTNRVCCAVTSIRLVWRFELNSWDQQLHMFRDGTPKSSSDLSDFVQNRFDSGYSVKVVYRSLILTRYEIFASLLSVVSHYGVSFRRTTAAVRWLIMLMYLMGNKV